MFSISVTRRAGCSPARPSTPRPSPGSRRSTPGRRRGSGTSPLGPKNAWTWVDVAFSGAVAASFGDAGRFGVSREEARALPSFSTRSERVLYEASLDDLGAADPGRRRRAADGL